MREPGGRRRRERGGAYQIGRLAVFALIVIVLVIILLLDLLQVAAFERIQAGALTPRPS